MMSASNSPPSPAIPQSILSQRLKEAEALDIHLSDLERARKELQQRRSSSTRSLNNGPPPPPPPRPPISPPSSAPHPSSSFVRLLSLAPDFFPNSISSFSRQEVLHRLNQLVEHVDSEGMTTTTTTTMVVQRHVLPVVEPNESTVGRIWEAVITSATVRHGRVEYEIRSQLSCNRVTGTSVVRRRFRDFDRLYHALKLHVSDFVLIPRLPPKDGLMHSRVDPDFVWDRRIALQFWLRYMFTHRVLRNSTLLREFLWEPASCAVSNEKKRFEDHHFTAEQALWSQALKEQQRNVESLFENDTVALTSLRTRIALQKQSLRQASERVYSLVKHDSKLARIFFIASQRMQAFGRSQVQSGQNFTFLTAFATVLPAKDVNRKLLLEEEDSYLVSFNPTKATNTNTSNTNKHESSFVEAPISQGATCDVRSLKALGSLLHLWGQDLLPELERHMVSPKRKDADAHRIACEWTETQSLKLGMVRDCLLRVVWDQIRHAQEERDKWIQVKDTIESQQNYLVALSDEPLCEELSTLSVNGGGVAAEWASNAPQVAGQEKPSTFSSSSLTSSPDSLLSFHHHHHPSSVAAAPALHLHLDKDLDQAQARFLSAQNHESFLKEQESSNSSVDGFRNPFDDE